MASKDRAPRVGFQPLRGPTLWFEGTEGEITERSNEIDMKMFSRGVYLEEILAATSFICLIAVKRTGEYP